MYKYLEENNLSETAFFVKEDEVYSLRWFTSTSEVDMCGHATLASAYVLFECMDYDKELVYPLLFNAIEKNEIENRDANSIFIGLHNTFFATPMLLNRDELDKLESIYIEQVSKILNIKKEVVS